MSSIPAPSRHGASLTAAVHGVVKLRPAVLAAHDAGTRSEDAFSLAVKRSVMLGLADFQGREISGLRWGHNDASNDWTQDGRIRQAAWLQVVVLGDAPLGLPIHPLVSLLSDVVDRVADFQFTGLHAVVPMHLATDNRFGLANAAGWFATAEPGKTDLTVTILGCDGKLDGDVGPAAEAARELAHDLLGVESNRFGPPLDTLSATMPLAGAIERTGLTNARHFRCTAPEWSTDVGAWVVEVFVEAMRAIGVQGPALVAVSSARDDGQL